MWMIYIYIYIYIYVGMIPYDLVQQRRARLASRCRDMWAIDMYRKWCIKGCMCWV